MTRAPLLVLVKVEPAAQPVVDALERLNVNIGSVAAAKLYVNAPSDARLLCVALADDLAVARFAADLRDELADNPAARELCGNAKIVPLQLDARLIVFTDIAALEMLP